MARLCLTAAALALVICLPVFALDPNHTLSEYGHQVWLSENGLPQNTVQAITQTRDGYIWIGTQDGLARFDGVKFEIFDKQNTPHLQSNDIRALFTDGSGTLWIATSLGLIRRGSGGEFETFEANPWSGNYLGPIAEDQDRSGSVRFVTSRGLVSCQAGKCALDEMSETLANSIKNLLVRADGNLLIVTSTDLKLLKNGALTEWTVEGLKSANVTAVAEDNNGTLWFGTSEGVSEVRDGKATLYSVREGLPNGRINCLHVDRAGTVWIGTSSGLARLRNGQFETLTADNGLSSNLVLSIFEDREGSVWVGTEAGGLNLLKNRKFTTFTSKDGLGSDLVKAIYQDPQGGVWMGTNGGGLTLLKNGKTRTFTTRDGLASDVVLSLAGDDAGNLWIGTPDGLNLLKDGRFKTFTVADGLSNDLVRSIYVDKRGDLWVGTRAGLNRFHNDEFTIYTTKDGLANDFVGALFEDSKGNLWIGTLGGLSKFAGDTFTTFTTGNGLSSNTVTCLFEDQSGDLWIGTNGGGLNRLHDDRFESFTSRDGLPDDVIYRILEDGNERLWCSSNKGVFRLDKRELNALAAKQIKTLTPTLYGTPDGMLTRECSGGGHPAAWKMNDGKLWFATIKGVAAVDADHLAVNSIPPPLVIEQVRVDDQPASLNTSLKVAAGSTRFDFYYTAPSFIAPENVRFKYRLEGFDRDWIDGGNRRVAYYTNLRPGNYKFRVMAANSDGVWNEQGAALDFYLEPRFYQTYWFYALALLLLGAIGWQLYRLRVRRISSQFGAVLAERNRIAREIHDNLAQDILGISVQLELVARLLPAVAESAKPHLDRARILVRNSMAEARRYVWDLRSQDLEQKDLPTALNDTARRLTRDTEVQAAVQVTGTFRPVPTSIENNLLRIAQEAINNSVKHSGAKRIMIDLHFETDGLQLRVQDDGNGFDTTLENRDGHFGLVGMRERASEIKGDLRIQSEPGSGTQVIVNVPLRHGDGN
jgi:ligand-binding sensor domain-containing protein/signal transduction histidine kinase